MSQYEIARAGLAVFCLVALALGLWQWYGECRYKGVREFDFDDVGNPDDVLLEGTE